MDHTALSQSRKPARIRFASTDALQYSMSTGYVDFLEDFSGCGQLTQQMSQVGLAVGVGIDCRNAAYGQTWDLTVETHRLRLAHLLNRVYVSSSCTVVPHAPRFPFSASAVRSKPIGTFCSLPLTWPSTNHFKASSCRWKIPPPSALWVQPRWLEHFGSRARPMLPWRFFASDGCQHGQISPGIHEDGQPFLKGQTWMANYSLADLELRCKQPFCRCSAASIRTVPFWVSAHGNWLSFHRRV